MLRLTISCSIVWLCARKTEFPLLLNKQECPEAFLFDIVLSENSIMELRAEIEQVLRNHHICEKTVYRCMLVTEEVNMLILRHNQLSGKKKDKSIFCECNVLIGDEVVIIFRDNGALFDITDSDLDVTSMRAYVVSGMMRTYKNAAHLTTMSYNRNIFSFPVDN